MGLMAWCGVWLMSWCVGVWQQRVQQQRVPTELCFSLDANKQQRQLIAELEDKNRSVGTCLHLLPSKTGCSQVTRKE